MNDTINFNITFKTKSEAEKALSILKEMSIDDVSCNGWLNFWKNELIIDGTQITVEDDNFYADRNCDELESIQIIIPAIIKELRQKMTGTTYDGFAFYSDEYCYQEDYTFNQTTAKMVVSPNGCGFCEDCGEVVVYIDEYNPDQEYYCPTCGKLFDHDELFLGERPTVQYF